MAIIYFDTPAHYTTGLSGQLFQEKSHRSRSSASKNCKLNDMYTKYVHRQVVLAWKRITRATRKPERASRLPEGFVLINSRRRSIFFG